MAITDELREWARNNTVQDKVLTTYPVQHHVHGTVESLLRIADRIDTEHERGMNERADRYSELRAKMNNCYVELPKAADGEYIHIGDVMEGVDKYNSLREVTGRVTTISFEADGLIEVAVQARNDDGKTWRRAYLDPCASLYRHHHEPTVEDVLRDYASRILIADCIDEEDTLVAEYAAKLRLAVE